MCAPLALEAVEALFVSPAEPNRRAVATVRVPYPVPLQREVHALERVEQDPFEL